MKRAVNLEELKKIVDTIPTKKIEKIYNHGPYVDYEDVIYPYDVIWYVKKYLEEINANESSKSKKK